MKNAKYLISTIMICLLLVMGLAACSGPANEPVTDPDTEVTEEISDEDVELTILDPEEEDVSDDTAAEEQAESGSSSDNSDKSGKSGSSDSSDDGLIGEDEAIKIVLKRVKGATKDDIVSFEKDYDDGRWQYEGTLVYDGLEYEFEIDAQNGNILDWEIDD